MCIFFGYRWTGGGKGGGERFSVNGGWRGTILDFQNLARCAPEEMFAVGSPKSGSFKFPCFVVLARIFLEPMTCRTIGERWQFFGLMV